MKRAVFRFIAIVITVAILGTLFSGCERNLRPEEKGYGMLPEVDLEAYRGTKIVEATWKDPFLSEDGPGPDAFEEEYGIDYDRKMIDQGEYVSGIASCIAADEQIDIFYETGDFPGSLTVMQPIDAAKLDLSSRLWNQSIIKASTLGGKTYLVDGVSSIITELDLCVYNKELFENNGVTTPEEYYEAGEWTFANFRKAAMEIASIGEYYSGAGVLGDNMLGAAGCSTFIYENGKMKVGIDDRYIEVLTAMAQMRVDGYIKLDRFGFDDGKQGMCFTNVSGIKKGGYFTHINPDLVRATYLPVWEEGDEQVYTGIYRGYGLVKGAKNPVGAGIYLSYCLNNVNREAFRVPFLNEEVEEFFYELTGGYPDDVLYYRTTDMMKTTGKGEQVPYAFMDRNPDEIKPYLDSVKPTLEEMVDDANKIIEEKLKE